MLNKILKSVISVAILMALIMTVTANDDVSGTKQSTSDVIEKAHNVLWSFFVDRHGIILDYVGEVPTPEDCALGKPNAIGWWSPIENGPMYTGVYLAAMCERARRTGEPADKGNAKTLAKGLLKCASVSDVPGMIVRGIASDGKSHYPLGSDDQTHPWFLGLYVYWKSDLSSETEKKEIVNKVKEVAGALESNGWNCPCDGAFKKQFRGGFNEGDFRAAVRYLFMLKAVYEMTGDAVWLERYKTAMTERPGKRGLTRLELCSAGYGPDIEYHKWDKKTWAWWTWIYVGAQSSLKQLVDMETDPEIKAKYQAGLAASAKEALKELAQYNKFDNQDTKLFGESKWREVYTEWFPQKTQADAGKLSDRRNQQKGGERSNYEKRLMGSPLAAAVIVATAGNPAHFELVAKAINHYDYEKLFQSRFLYAECAYYACPAGFDSNKTGK
jgi:hypothetical protein